jgi:hypothetical protein
MFRQLDMGPIFFSLTNPEPGEPHRVEWSPEQWMRTVEEYRKFLTLAHEGKGMATVPSRNVDLVWHTHVLDTAKYYDDMMKTFGHIVHHYPYFGVASNEDRHALLDAYQDTKKRYLERFGELAPEDVWGLAARCGSSHCSGPKCRIG